MKRSKLLSLSAFLLILSAAIACDEGSDSSLFDSDDLQTPELSLFSLDDAMGALEDATLERDMHFRAGFMDGRSPGSGPDAGGLLRSFDLTRDQKLAILSTLTGFFECIQGPLADFREANEPILEAARQQRGEIVDAFRAGEIDREQAREQLRELSRMTRDAIRDNPANEPIRAAICACTAERLEQVRSILNDEQRAAWDAWIAGHDHDCTT